MAVNGYWDEEGIFHAQAPKQFTFSPQARAAALAKREANKKRDSSGDEAGSPSYHSTTHSISSQQASSFRKELEANGWEKAKGGSGRGQSWTAHRKGEDAAIITKHGSGANSEHSLQHVGGDDWNPQTQTGRGALPTAEKLPPTIAHHVESTKPVHRW